MSHPLGSLTAYVDGALEPAERAEIESHLAGCGACRAERDRLQAAIALLRRLPPPPAASTTFEQRFYARLAQEAGARPGRGFLDRIAWRWLAPALAGVAASVGVVLYSGAQRRADEAFLAEHIDLFESYEAVASVGAVESTEDVQVVAHLDDPGEQP